MKEKRTFFKILTIAFIGLFLLTCVSIIVTVMNGPNIGDDEKVVHTLGFVYQLLHLIVLAILIYMSLKAYLKGSQLVEIIMSDDKGELNKKAVIRSIIFASIFGVLTIYFLLLSFGLNLFLGFFPIGLKLALTNLFGLIAVISIFLSTFKPLSKEEK